MSSSNINPHYSFPLSQTPEPHLHDSTDQPVTILQSTEIVNQIIPSADDLLFPRGASKVTDKKVTKKDGTFNYSEIKSTVDNLPTEKIESARDFENRVTDEEYKLIFPFDKKIRYVVSGKIVFLNSDKKLDFPENLLVLGSLEIMKSTSKLSSYLETTGNLRFIKNTTTMIDGYLIIGNNLDISDCEKLTKIKAYLKITGAFIAQRCFCLQEIPDSLNRVIGHFDVTDCRSLKHLPIELTVKGYFIARNTSLTNLTLNKLDVTGHVTLDDNPDLTHLPEKFFSVGGNLSLKNTKKLKQLSPEILHVPGSIYLDGAGITVYPEKWTLEGDVLSLKFCRNLKKFETTELIITSKLYMQGCIELDALPDIMEIGPNTLRPSRDKIGVAKKSATPRSTEIISSSYISEIVLDISGCTKIKTLPYFLIARGNVCADRLFSLTKILRTLGDDPENVTIFGHWEIYGNLSLNGCKNLSNFHEKYKFGCICSADEYEAGIFINGDIDLSNCINITSLSENFLNMGCKSDGTIRTINLENTGIPEKFLLNLEEKIKAGAYPGIKVIFSTGKVKSKQNFENLNQALEFWQNLAKVEQHVITTHNLNLELALQYTSDIEEKHTQKENKLIIATFVNFLNGLTGTADYINMDTRVGLAEAVVDILDKITQLNDKYKRQAFSSIVGATDSCADRVSKSLDDLFIAVKIATASHHAEITGDESKLKELAYTIMLQEIIEDIILNYINGYAYEARMIDEVQERIKITKELYKEFKLDILITKNFNDINKASVDEEFIKKSIETIKSKTSEEAIEKYINEWSVLKEIRRIYESEILFKDFQQLPVKYVDCIHECCIDSCTSEQMVVDGKDPSDDKYYSMSAFKRIYQEFGVNSFTKQEIDLKQVYRLVEIKK